MINKNKESYKHKLKANENSQYQLGFLGRPE